MISKSLIIQCVLPLLLLLGILPFVLSIFYIRDKERELGGLKLKENSTMEQSTVKNELAELEFMKCK